MSNQTIRGVILMLFANVVFCCMAALVRFLSDCNAWTTTLFRFVTGIGIISLFALSGRIHLTFVDNRGLLLRGFLGGIATAIFFYSISKIGLVKAGFIAGLYPAFATLFSHYILKERLSPIKWLALAGSFGGIILIMNSNAKTNGLFSGYSRYDLFALTGTMLAGLSVVSVKKLQTTDSTVAIFFAQCCIGAFIVFIPASIGQITISPGILLLLISVGILATVGQLLSTDSYRYLSVSTGSLLVMTIPVFNCIAGLVLFHEPVTPLMIIGALVIAGSSLGFILVRD